MDCHFQTHDGFVSLLVTSALLLPLVTKASLVVTKALLRVSLLVTITQPRNTQFALIDQPRNRTTHLKASLAVKITSDALLF